MIRFNFKKNLHLPHHILPHHLFTNQDVERIFMKEMVPHTDIITFDKYHLRTGVNNISNLRNYNS